MMMALAVGVVLLVVGALVLVLVGVLIVVMLLFVVLMLVVVEMGVVIRLWSEMSDFHHKFSSFGNVYRWRLFGLVTGNLLKIRDVQETYPVRITHFPGCVTQTKHPNLSELNSVYVNHFGSSCSAAARL